MNKAALFALVGSLLVSSTLLACSSHGHDESEEAPAPETQSVTTATVKGSVTYAGAKTGMLRVALYESFPPKGAPKAGHSYAATSFPMTYELSAPVGDYFVVAFLDVNGDGYEPSAGDPMSLPAKTNVAASGATVDIALADGK